MRSERLAPSQRATMHDVENTSSQETVIPILLSYSNVNSAEFSAPNIIVQLYEGGDWGSDFSYAATNNGILKSYNIFIASEDALAGHA